MFKHSVSLFLLSCIFLASCTTSSAPSVQTLSSPASANSHLPRLISDNEGNIFMSWVEEDTLNEDMAVLKYASLDNGEWTSPRVITRGDDWFVNWADFPSMTVASGRPQAAHWLQKVPGSTYSYHVKVSVTGTNDSWSSSFSPHMDNTATEHGFVSMVPWQESQTLAIWLDGRETADREEGDYFDMDKSMTLRSAIINKDGSIAESKLIDDTVCDCCQTALVKTSNGALAAFRNRAKGEIRDIYITRYENGAWSKPEPVHNDGWKIGACPVNGPSLAINKSVAVVTWYTGADNQRRVKAAVSTDGGATFSSPVTIDGENPLGRVDAVISDKGIAYVSWMERSTEGDKAELRVQGISREGKPLASEIITTMDASRKSGFPQMELQDNQLIFAWTDIDDVKQVRMASLPAAFAD